MQHEHISNLIGIPYLIERNYEGRISHVYKSISNIAFILQKKYTYIKQSNYNVMPKHPPN